MVRSSLSIARFAAFATCACLISCAGKKGIGESVTYGTKPLAVTPTLKFLWHDQLTSWEYLGSDPKEFAAPTHIGSSDELVAVTSEGEVVKYQAGNGLALWRRRFDAPYHAGATVGAGHVFVADLEGRIRALNANTGADVWEWELGHTVESRGVVNDGRLFISDAADRLTALDAATGKPLWTYSRDFPEYFTVKGSCTPVIDDDAVLCGFSDGTLVAVQMDTGDKLWEADLSGGKRNFADVDGAVHVTEDRIFAVSYAGGIYALERGTGTIIWRSESESVADWTMGFDRLFIATATGRVQAYALDNGAPMWSFKMNQSLPGSLQTFGPYVLAFATDGPLYVLDAETGYAHTKWIGTSGFLAPAERGSSRVYAISNHGQLFGLKLAY